MFSPLSISHPAPGKDFDVEFPMLNAFSSGSSSQRVSCPSSHDIRSPVKNGNMIRVSESGNGVD